MANTRSGGFWRRLRQFHWGEATLWLAFMLLAVAAVSGTGSDRETFVTLAGVLALAAIGVRATRPERKEDDATA